MFELIHADSREREILEQLGAKPKFWFRDAAGRRCLFKVEERGTGEDWAEKVACELCALLGLPHVHYELAVDDARSTPGVVCATCAEAPVALVLGNQLLLEHDSAYPAERKYRVQEHTVDAVAAIVGLLEPPAPEWMVGAPAGIGSALDVFVGYVMLDAWIANQDRHHENWGALRTGDSLRLAPTFDHGASMARNISDEERHERLTTKDSGRWVDAFARRALSAFYPSPAAARAMTTMAAWEAFSGHAVESSNVWLGQLAGVQDDQVEYLLREVPPQRLSSIGREFVMRLLRENRRRLLEGDTG